jgi:hypothetical protein
MKIQSHVLWCISLNLVGVSFVLWAIESFVFKYEAIIRCKKQGEILLFLNEFKVTKN